ncbi:MAG: phenylacetate--CoA ligase [Sedimentisphaerales bacterium]|nr:phenylacetate--CoA ligase [Sedimentisphaerales bacterium]
MEVLFWNKELETLPRPKLEKMQFQRLQKTVDQALKTHFYQRRLGKAGITSGKDICCLKDLQKVPFTNKDDLRKNFPFGMLAVDFEQVVRLHSSSGTTGIPTVIYLTQEDLNRWTDLVARSVVATGCTKKDVFQNMMTYGLFTGGLGLHYGAERVGMTVIPIGGGNTQRQVHVMKDFKTTTVHITPSYLLHIHSKLSEYNMDIDELHLKRAFLGAEPYSENTRLKLEELYGIDAFNSYGLSEMNGPGVAFECIYKQDMHVWEDAYIVEIIDPVTGEVLEDGAKGEVVFTILTRDAMPLLRYRTRDLAFLHPEVCSCGRTHRRLSRILGRTDDMLIINGVNVFPSQIEEVIMSIPEVGTNYQIQIDKAGALDRLTVKVEIYAKMFTGEASALDALKVRIMEKLRASITINPRIELHEPGVLPAFEGKAKRVVDTREAL